MNAIPTIKSEKIADDLFILSLDADIICYAPLRNRTFFIKDLSGVNLLKDYFSGSYKEPELNTFLKENGLLVKAKRPQYRIDKPYEPINLVLSLSSDCNLRCTYCYASAGELHNSLTWETIEKAINLSVEANKNLGLKKLKLLFHGGGEALVRWDLLKRATELVEELWSGDKNFSIVTNATLITKERALWFKEHGFRLSISLDGPKDVHDLQRPKANGSGSFDDSIIGMSYLYEAKVPFGIRSTICRSNIDRMKEMLLIAKAFNTGLKVEPLTITGRAEESLSSISFQDFYEALLDAQSFAKRIGVRFTSTYYHDLRARTEFCSGNGNMFCVLPGGFVSTCTRVTKQDDDLADIFILGHVGSEALVIDQDKVSEVRNLSIVNLEQCEDCFAKWYCVGGCHHSRLSAGGQMPEEHCVLTKALLFANLTEKLKSNDEGGD